MVGLAPTRYLLDEFVTDPTGLFRDMQSVFAKVRAAVSSLRVGDLGQGWFGTRIDLRVYMVLSGGSVNVLWLILMSLGL